MPSTGDKSDKEVTALQPTLDKLLALVGKVDDKMDKTMANTDKTSDKTMDKTMDKTKDKTKTSQRPAKDTPKTCLKCLK